MILLIAAMVLFGCTRSVQKSDPVSKPVVEKQAQKSDSDSKPDVKPAQKRAPVSKPDAKKDGIVFAKPVINPPVVSAGETFRQELKYSISAPKTGNLNILEVIVISGEGLKLELARKRLERTQGNQVSTFQFKTPKGLPPGEYQLITTVTYGKESGKTIGRLRVKR
jgi:hypothetical protein